MIHPDTALRFINSDIGYGVCATEFIPRGTLVWVQDELDIVLSPDRADVLNPLLKKTIEHYAFINTVGNYVLCWDSGRYVNHGCDPTTVSVGNFCTISARDLHPGEQLTEEYSTLNIASALECRCGSPHCRSKVQSLDLTAHAQQLDARAEQAMISFLQVNQPLLALLGEASRNTLLSFARGEGKLPSCLDNLCSLNIEKPTSGKAQETFRGLWARS